MAMDALDLLDGVCWNSQVHVIAFSLGGMVGDPS